MARASGYDRDTRDTSGLTNRKTAARDFVEDHTSDGRRYRALNVMDEFTQESLAIVPARRFRSWDVINVLVDLFLEHDPHKHVRSDNGPEFIAIALRAWLDRLGSVVDFVVVLFV